MTPVALFVLWYKIFHLLETCKRVRFFFGSTRRTLHGNIYIFYTFFAPSQYYYPLHDLKTHKNAGSVVPVIYFRALNFREKINFVLTLVFFSMMSQ